MVISRRRRWALRYTESVIGALPASGAGGISVVKASVAHARRFLDNDKYIELQAERIRERINQFGGKLYLNSAASSSTTTMPPGAARLQA